MKFTINSQVLNKALKYLQPAVSTNNIIPITGYVLCKIEKDTCELTATNTHLTITHQVPCTFDKKAECLLPFKELLSITSVLPSQPLTISVGTHVEVIHDSGIHKCGIADNVINFPATPKTEYIFSMDVDRQFMDALKLAKNFVMKKQNSEQFFYFKDVLLEIEGEKISIVASDSEQIIRYQNACDIKIAHRCLFDTVLINSISGMDNATVSVSDRFIKISNLTTTVVCTLNTQTYPSVDRIFAPHKSNIEIPREDVLSALNKLMVFDDEYYAIVMDFNKKRVKLKYDNNEMQHHAEETLNIENTVPEGVLAFNGVTFKNIVQSTPVDSTIKFTFGKETDNVFLDTGNENISLLIRPIILINKN